ncbi:MAG: 2-deoxy-5-keto-D-gluconate 6-phosphate aldolase domain-containing protein [Dehalococcoidia bacterium]
MTSGFDRDLYVLLFDHRESLEIKMFGSEGPPTAERTAQIAAAKQVIYDGFKDAIAAGVGRGKAGILIDEQFGAAILSDAAAHEYVTACPAEKSGLAEFDFEYGEAFAGDIEKFHPTFCTAAGVPGFIGLRSAAPSSGTRCSAGGPNRRPESKPPPRSPVATGSSWTSSKRPLPRERGNRCGSRHPDPSADLARLGEQVAGAERAGADPIHVGSRQPLPTLDRTRYAPAFGVGAAPTCSPAFRGPSPR